VLKLQNLADCGGVNIQEYLNIDKLLKVNTDQE
jgi:hypothetical protein